MITSIEIENLRGIRSGRLEGLTPLTILTGPNLTGPNASGKSTVLDALLIAASPAPGEAVVHAVQRHPVVSDGAEWLFGPSGRTVKFVVGTTSGSSWKRELKWVEVLNNQSYLSIPQRMEMGERKQQILSA